MISRTYVTGTGIAEITDSRIKDMLGGIDQGFNEVMINAFTHGIYTGVVVVALWATASRIISENYRTPHFLVVIILILYFLATFSLYENWTRAISYLIAPHSTGSWEIYLSGHPSTSILLALGIDAILSAVLADATLIWRCWIVWGRSWRVVLVPITCTTLAIASRGIVAYYSAFGPIENVPPQALYLENIVNWAVLYSSLILATLLWCTILIVYRILRVGGTAGRTGLYQRVIEMLVESTLLYSAVIVALLVFQVRNEGAANYVAVLAAAIRGMAPTILVGRVAAGHARPDDSWSENISTSSLRFRSNSSSHNDSEISVGSGWDTSSRARLDLEEGSEDNTQSYN
ncbi:hypothetical protein ARMGADRAFT_1064533 [Armillaria gallica]|uniref:Family A G protein-coupled receptor-like protein n=1 Tax=Armillaria gallica TaxID=47427 RepID=A0A2H3D596_ARMGA|nr:hypothetical protein ARMGADRAFT_1064533 [Armillaria gallica]